MTRLIVLVLQMGNNMRLLEIKKAAAFTAAASSTDNIYGY